MNSMLGCVVCPVCARYLHLRQGVTLQEHLNMHPKELVIDALVRYAAVYKSEGPSKQYQEFVNAFPRVAATLVYPVYGASSSAPGESAPGGSGSGGSGPSSAAVAGTALSDAGSSPSPPPPPPPLADETECQCGGKCTSTCHYITPKQEIVKVDHIYETESGPWTPVANPTPEVEEPTNLCLRQVDSPPANQIEKGQPSQLRQIVNNGPALRSGGGTIEETGEGRTILNLSEPGPVSVLELGGVHFLVPSRFLGNPTAAVTTQCVFAQMTRQDSVVGPAPPTAYPKRQPSPYGDTEGGDVGVVADSPCSVYAPDSAPSSPASPLASPLASPPASPPASPSSPSSPFVKRVESPINIRSDEMMPAHGEISEQESVGGNSSCMWPDQNFSSVKEQPCYELYKGSETSELNVESTVSFSGQSVSFSSSLPPPLAPPLAPPPPLANVIEDKKKKPARVPTCRWCRMTFSRPAERRAHICDKKGKDPAVEPSTSDMQVQKPKRVYKRKPKENAVDMRFNEFADVLVNKLEREGKLADVASNGVADAILGAAAAPGAASGAVGSAVPGAVPSAVPGAVNVNVSAPLAGGEPLVKSFKCNKCNEDFHSYRVLAIHRGREHKGNRFECTTCSETFEAEAKYHDHLLVHPLECKLCGKLFYRRKSIALHMKRHLSVKPYQCDHCDKSFVTKQKLEEHSNIHTGNAPIKCPLCDETFRRHSNLVQHKNRHHFNVKSKKKDFICHCGEVYHTKKKLEWHKEIHDEKPKSCSFCNERFVHSSSLTRHIRKAHDERYLPKVGRELENVQCVVCQAVFLKSSLAVHMRTHSGARSYPCHICGRNFTTKWNLHLHRWTHASRSTKPFKCTQCKSAFHRRLDFTSHMRSHRNIRPYTCNHCGCQFIRKYNCVRHMNEHEKTKSYSCTICEKTFHRGYYLKEHMRVHSKTRPYSCHICGKASSSKSNHNKHVKIHHAREPQNTEG